MRDAIVDALPPRSDEVDEEREVVDAGVALREDVALDALEAANHLVHQPSDLGEVARDREHLLAKAVLYRAADAIGEARLELGRGIRQSLDLLPRPLERRVHGCRLYPSRRRGFEAFAGPCDRVVVHPPGG